MEEESPDPADDGEPGQGRDDHRDGESTARRVPAVPDVVIDETAAAWDFVDEDESACGRGVFVYFNKHTGAVTTVPFYCKDETCRRCSIYKTNEDLTHAAHCFTGYDRVHVAILRASTRAEASANHQRVRDRVKKRRSDRKKNGVAVEYLLAHREDVVMVFATELLSGDDEPRVWMHLRVEDALILLAHQCLKVPRSRRGMSTSRGWARASCALCKQAKRGSNSRLGTYGSKPRFEVEHWEPFARDVEQIAGRRPHLGIDPPAGITWEEWRERMSRGPWNLGGGPGVGQAAS